MAVRQSGRRRGRLRRGRLVVLLVVVGVLGTLVQLARSSRPVLDTYAEVVVTDASVGTTYAVDEQLCLRVNGSGTVREVRGTGTRGGLDVDLVLPPRDTPPVIAFPVEPDAGRPAEGAVVDEGGTCLRLLLTGQRQGRLTPPELQVVVGYGPGDVLRRTLSVRPPSRLEVVRTGPDPRLDPEG